MSLCERIITGLSSNAVLVADGAEVNAAEIVTGIGRPSSFEIQVRWEIPDFQNLMENSKCGLSITCKEKFSHESMPGIAWELILYPNGKEDYSHHVGLFMRPILTSSKKSQATAPSGGFSLRFEPVNANRNSAPPPERTLPVQQFSLKSELGTAQFAHQPLVDTHCLAANGSVALVGKILVELSANSQTLFLRKLFESSKHADFTIKIDVESFPVHKNILSEASPAMEAMFDAEFVESANGFVVVKDTSSEAVRALLQFWYGDPLCFDGLEELSMDVYKLANRYQDFELRQICVDALSRMASRENVLHLAAFAVDQSCEPLEKVAAKLILQNADILKEEAWTQFKNENFMLALTVAERIVRMRRTPQAKRKFGAE